MNQDRDRLKAAIEDRALELRLRLRAVARRAEMSEANLFRIRNGEIAITPFAAAGIERALEWEPGTVEKVLAGHAPAARRKEHSPPELPAGWGIDPKKWARYDPIDREMIVNAIRLAEQRAQTPGTRSHPNAGHGRRA
jgi:AraC-like DNA-binding protein